MTDQTVNGYRHESSDRANLPTEQNEQLMQPEDKAPEPYVPEIRSRSGPVLSWDRGPELDHIRTDATPLYVSERIHPSAFVDQLRRKDPAPLFADFNNLPPDAAWQWYQHRANWSNRLIRGESVQVMASLLQKEGMEGQVQMIYMDPPYGISFKSNLQVATDDRNTPNNNKAVPADPKQVQTFRDSYERGIDSYLDNLYRNFVHARHLLADSGSIFVQIGAQNVNRVAMLLDEVFGVENRVAQIAFSKRGSADTALLPQTADYILWYCKSRESIRFHQIYERLSDAEALDFRRSYTVLEFPDGNARRPTQAEFDDPSTIPDGARPYMRERLMSQGAAAPGSERGKSFTVPGGRTHKPPQNEHWSVSQAGLRRLAGLNRLCEVGKGSLHYKRYVSELPGRRINNVWARQMSASSPKYVVETAESVIERCMLMSTDPGDLVLDITGGGVRRRLLRNDGVDAGLLLILLALLTL